jgi:CRP/FNR family transcriptional regulator, cyclic AMP receptor protein
VPSPEAGALASVPLFQGLSAKELDQISRLGQEVEFGAGQPIVETGTSAMDFYLIVDGEAALAVPGGRTQTLGPGSTFGELSVLDGEPRSASVTATSRVVALRIPRPEFIAMLDQHGTVARKILVELSRRLRRAEDAARGGPE